MAGLSPNQITGLLKYLGHRHEDLADRLRVDRSTVTHVIHRDFRSPRVRRAIAATLGHRYEYVWGEPDPDSEDLGGAARAGGDEPPLERAASF